jgi:hypothetical protein
MGLSDIRDKAGLSITGFPLAGNLLQELFKFLYLV